MAHNPPDVPLFNYRVQHGQKFGKQGQHAAGDVVVLTEHEAAPLVESGKLKLVGPAEDKSEGDEEPSPLSFSEEPAASAAGTANERPDIADWTISEIMDAVDDGTLSPSQALDAEQARPESDQRSTLIARLESML